MPRITMIVIQLGLTLGIAILLIGIVNKHRHSGELHIEAPSSEQSNPSQNAAQKGSPSFSNYRFIDQRNLFQTSPDDTEDEAEIDLSALKQTELKLKLWGTITGPDTIKRAVLEDTKQRRQVILREQDEVASAKIKMILRDKIVLVVNGEDQILEMEKVGSDQAKLAVPRNAPAVQRTTTLPGSAKDRTSTLEARIRIRPSLSKQLSETPENWDQFAVVSPYEDESGNNGLIVNRVTPASPLRRLGIRNGDILLGIDDEPVESMKDMMAFFQQAESGDEIVVQLKRRGKIRDLTFFFE